MKAVTVDVDSHVYEQPEIWDRYVPVEDRGIARAAFYHEVDSEGNRLTIVNGAVTLQEVVEVLNVLGVTPRDMIQILQLMAQSGMLHAEILVM